MRLAPRAASRSPISLVAMIDVLMILLVFFMVTSTYLDLDMIPMAERSDASGATATPGEGAGRLLIRLAADGQVHMQGQALDPADLGSALTARLTATPELEIIVLPSGGAAVQALVTVMDSAVSAGASRVRIVRLEALP